MRVIYLFAGGSSAQPNHTMQWSLDVPTPHPLAGDHMRDEGFYAMWNRLAELGIVDEVVTVITCGRHTGFAEYTPTHHCVVIPHIEDLRSHIRPDDIIVTRGGFKWDGFLSDMHAARHWMLFYAANANRVGWPFWDVVLDDLVERNAIGEAGRLILAFHKPTNPHYFSPTGVQRCYDVCLGASHVHDKKRQYLGVNMLVEYKRMFGCDLRAVLPGSFRRSTHTLKIHDTIAEHGLDVHVTGGVSRTEVARILNQSWLYLHLSHSGQNDRGAMEALRCGTPIVLTTPNRHAPFLVKDDAVCLVTEHAQDPAALAAEVQERLYRASAPGQRERAYAHYEEHNGMDTVVIPQMRKLFEFMRKHPQADREALAKEYVG